MTAATYALRLYRSGYVVNADAGPLLVTVDLDEPVTARLLLNRHMAGELRRQGMREDQWAEFEMRAHALDRRGESREVAFRWAYLPDQEDQR